MLCRGLLENQWRILEISLGSLSLDKTLNRASVLTTAVVCYYGIHTAHKRSVEELYIKLASCKKPNQLLEVTYLLNGSVFSVDFLHWNKPRPVHYGL